MTSDFKTLNQLEKNRMITIGIRSELAHKFFYRNTLIGKVLLLLFPIIIIGIVPVFVRYGFIAGLLSFILSGLYTVSVGKISAMYLRKKLMADEQLFNDAYDSRACNIRLNHTGDVILYPADWYLFIGNE